LDLASFLQDLELLHHDLWLVVDGEDGPEDRGADQSLDLKTRKLQVAGINESFGHGENNRPKPQSKASFKH